MEEKEVISTYRTDAAADSHFMGSVSIKLPGTLTVENQPAPGQSVSFRVDWIQGVGVRPVAITVASLKGEEITSTDLRAVKAKNLWRAAIVNHATYHRLVFFEKEDGDLELPAMGPVQFRDELLEKLRLKGPVKETLEYVTDLYMFADTLGLAPALYVQEVFAGENLEPLPRTTATKWIKRARDMGLFEGYFDGDD
ncbi:hypothetical protein [Glutamicibacter uratoxydans]|uniref:hypothetical protein n=1 Tax=Glutamicibacter uratoxydans TaxID=43667 RepID=UPI003D6FEB46